MTHPPSVAAKINRAQCSTELWCSLLLYSQFKCTDPGCAEDGEEKKYLRAWVTPNFMKLCLPFKFTFSVQDALLLQTLQRVPVNLSTLPCWRWEVEARAGAGVTVLGSLWLWRRRRDRSQSLAVGGLVHWVGSSSSICSLLAATTLGVIVPDRDEKRGGGRSGVWHRSREKRRGPKHGTQSKKSGEWIQRCM